LFHRQEMKITGNGCLPELRLSIVEIGRLNCEACEKLDLLNITPVQLSENIL